MRAEIKSYSMVGGELANYWPDDPTDFCVGMDVTVGVIGGEGGDIFSFEVCSPKWFHKNRVDKPTFARHVLFVNEYDEAAIKLAVQQLVNSVFGETWDEIATTLARYMFWEFEDYDVSSPSA
ncbi:immunity 8 family protein [Agrobacterium radiobacter]|uniref:Immunity protein 8 n=1 Tax=Agrobacterium tumefaciens str. B6 TaxID=1183423 RepID=A0A822V021_AGRTU|nr:immunity 8 family protein [Agrobacterium tumefaciens]KWT86876.1 hypothetical protein ASB65_23280 [Agrobacterium tumefaciens str. B6]MQB26438.1 hypothetical protein [Agrobacterium tumefaciens]NTA06434.1 hypothetical protein [Agrobacterium tumefaciens]NTA92875.1 hypothetical protein [Agrobacterium tumefaciens]NTB14081.1 hypothetical protein [Agrobacterium tumefaciens]